MKTHTPAPSDMEKLEFLEEWMRGNPLGPHTLEIHPTYRCNLQCSFCKYHAARTRQEANLDIELPLRRWLTILDEAAALNTKEVRICGGGEPMYDSNLTIKLMHHIKHLALRGSLLTNGTLISRELARELVDIKWNQLEVSVDGPEEAIHDSLRGVPGAFRRTSSALRWVAEWKRELGAQLPDIRLYFVVVAQNYHLIPRMIDYAHKHGATEIFLLSLCPGGLAENQHALTSRQAEDCLSIVGDSQRDAEKLDIRLCADLVENSLGASARSCQTSAGKDKLKPADAQGGLRHAPCFDPWTYLQVHFDGKVGPCCNTWVGGETEIKTRSLRDVWLNSMHLNRIRNSLLDWEFTGRCAECGIQHLNDSERIRPYVLRNGGS